MEVGDKVVIDHLTEKYLDDLPRKDLLVGVEGKIVDIFKNVDGRPTISVAYQMVQRRENLFYEEELCVVRDAKIGDRVVVLAIDGTKYSGLTNDRMESLIGKKGTVIELIDTRKENSLPWVSVRFDMEGKPVYIFMPNELKTLDESFSYGSILVNHWSSKENPHRTGIFVEEVKGDYRWTDGKGHFWLVASTGCQIEKIGQLDLSIY